MESTGCAIGMAEAAAGVKHGTWNLRWPHLLKKSRYPCRCQPGWEERAIIVAHVFNEHVCRDKNWTLQQLADWVSQFEPKIDRENVDEENLQGSPQDAVQ